jgi:hypothetical protein
LPAFLLLAARSASAAGKCEGQWHFELSSMGAEVEDWLPKDSWCRANRLPKVIDVTVRYRESGKAEISGRPYDVKDVGHAGTQCEFNFEGKASGLPEENELRIELDTSAVATSVAGKCSHYAPRTPDGRRLGTSAAVAVKVTRSAVGVAPPSADEALVASFVRACQERAADTLWGMMTARFQAEIEARAASLRRSASPKELRTMYGFRGRREELTGRVYWALSLKLPDGPDNPCAGADKWKLGESGNLAGDKVAVIRRPGRLAFGLKLVKEKGIWRLDQITPSMLDDDEWFSFRHQPSWPPGPPS